MTTQQEPLPAATTSAPETIPELRDAVLDTPGTVRVAGAGTASDWAGRPEPADLLVSTTRLRGIVAHNPGDMTAEVRAGTPLAALQEAFAEHGQRVALDAARIRDGATVGGLFATADSGPLALTYGPLRDLVIGATVVLADGTAARSGGHVIKNVAGYDLTKLLHGAHGTFGVVASLVLRLHPLPASTATVAVPAPRGEMTARARPVLDSQVEPTAIEWHDDRLLVRVEGTARGADGRADRLVELLGTGAARLGEDDADAAWAAHADAVAAPTDGAVLRIGVTPGRLVEVLDGIAADLGASVEQGRTAAHGGTAGVSRVTAAPATGVATLVVPADAEAVRAAHARVAAAGGTSSLRQRPPGAVLPAWGPEPATGPLLRSVAASLDPDQRFGRGRLAPWLPSPAVPRPGVSA